MRSIFFALAFVSIGTAQPVRPEAPNPEATSGAIQRRVAPPARINEFEARPASIQAGQQTVLVWSTENPNGVTIEPGIGRVVPRGTRAVSPTVTTTYTLTAHGPNNQVITKELTVTVAGGATAPNAAVSEPAKVPRLENGKPDLSGVYDAGLGGGPGRGGATPPAVKLKPGAEKYRVVRGPNDPGLTSDCMPLAPPQAFNVPYQVQLVQSAHSLAILHEYPGTFRIIPTDVGGHPVDPDPTWMGDSIGRWEGDTLVVDTIGFNDKTEISGFKHSEALHVVERFTRSDFKTVQYEATIEDANVFAEPWKITRRFTLRSDLNKVDEFVCEHNEDYSKYFKKE
ncbi:MAG TPA: hypothetical protein VGF16_21345 [Bryobacteraceae bacterium]|jgi:hypothetical protein